MRPRRVVGGLGFLVAVIAGCGNGLPGGSQPTATLSVRNRDDARVSVRIVGPQPAVFELEPCDDLDLALVPARWSVELSTTRERITLPVEILETGATTVIGIGADGAVSLGAPLPNPTCAKA